MASAVFFAAIGSGEFVVFGLDISIGDWVFLLEIGKQCANQHHLTGLLHLAFVFISAIKTGFLSFLHEYFAVDHFFFDLRLHIRCHRAARLLRGDLLDQLIHTARRHGLTVHNGQILRDSRCCQQAQGDG